MDFKDADIRNVLRVISFKGGINIIAGSEVQGKVSTRLVDVPWETALDVILKTYGFSYEKEGNIIRVTTIEKLRSEKEAEIALKTAKEEKEEIKIEVIKLTHIDGENAKAVIGGGKFKIFQKVDHEGADKGKVTYQEIDLPGLNIISGAGTLQSEPTTNSLLVHDRVSVIEKVKKLVGEIDKPISQILIETKIIETSLTDDEDLGIKWNISGNELGLSQGGKIPTTFPFDKKEATRGQFSPSIDPSLRGQGKTWPLATDLNPLAGPGHEEFFPWASSTGWGFGTLSFTQLKILLEALGSRADTDILSNPRVVTLNHQQAMIDVVSEWPIPTWGFNPDTGTMQVQGIGYKEYGISLVVTPTVYENLKIGLTLVPVVKDKVTTTQIEGAAIPVFDTQQVSTRVMVSSGDTVVIGGLIKNKKVKTITKVPILGDIPILSLLFKHSDTAIVKKDLLIFVTATVLNSEELVAFSKEAMDKKQLKKKK